MNYFPLIENKYKNPTKIDYGIINNLDIKMAFVMASFFMKLVLGTELLI